MIEWNICLIIFFEDRPINIYTIYYKLVISIYNMKKSIR